MFGRYLENGVERSCRCRHPDALHFLVITHKHLHLGTFAMVQSNHQAVGIQGIVFYVDVAYGVRAFNLALVEIRVHLVPRDLVVMHAVQSLAQQCLPQNLYAVYRAVVQEGYYLLAQNLLVLAPYHRIAVHGHLQCLLVIDQ